MGEICQELGADHHDGRVVCRIRTVALPERSLSLRDHAPVQGGEPMFARDPSFGSTIPLSWELLNQSVVARELNQTIRTRARSIYELRRAAGIPGDALDDWLAAEALISDELRIAPEAPDWN
jgi:hypothetical protein